MNRRIIWKAILTLSAVCGTASSAAAQQNPAGLAVAGTSVVADRFVPLRPGEVTLGSGFLGDRYKANENRRMLGVDENDLLDAFERRNAAHQDWQGEHAGKFLHAATLVWATTHDSALKLKIDRVAARLMRTQEKDGYLGTYRPENRWTRWDVWVHKYDLLGLLTYYQYTRNPAALAASRRVGDLLVRTFGAGAGQRDINRAGEHMGMAADSVLEPMVLLYRATKESRYLSFARYIVRNYDAPGGPAVLASLEQYGAVRRVANAKAYEMTSNFNGILELYRATGDHRLFADMQTAWKDIAQRRLYITGGASSFELFQDEFHLPNGGRSNICETCVTVTWEQMNLQMLRLTGDAKYAAEAERSIYNHLLAAQQPGGDDWSYYTPLEGTKPYDSATTCCHSSGPRGIALIPSIAWMASSDGGLVANLYNSSTVHAALPNAGEVAVTEKTEFPMRGQVDFEITPARAKARFPLRLRISDDQAPEYSLTVNGSVMKPARVGGYDVIDRVWKRGDRVQLVLTPLPRLVLGSHENANQAALKFGPLVLALDTALNPGVTDLNRVELSMQSVDRYMVPGGDLLKGVREMSELGQDPRVVKSLSWRSPGAKSYPAGPIFRVQGTVDGKSRTLNFTPYADAGSDGKSHFAVWIHQPGHASVRGQASIFAGAISAASRRGNHQGDITDGDPDTYRVTYDGARAERDWYEVALPTPVAVGRVVFAHGRTFHDGGWFDTSMGKPEVQVQTRPGGAWQTVARLDGYPAATGADPAGLVAGEVFEARFASRPVYAIRVAGKPASGDNARQAFSSCAEIQAFAR